MSDKLNTTSNGASLTPPQKKQNGGVLPSETSPTKLNLSSMLTNQDLNTDCMSIEEIYKLAREFVKGSIICSFSPFENRSYILDCLLEALKNGLILDLNRKTD